MSFLHSRTDTGDFMKHELLYRPNFTLARVMLDPGEAVTAEAGAMVSMSDDMEMKTKGRGGIGK
ncbi:AIM24 family protein, partial [bacterium]|nr:AIM24 family protein [bacterium]